MNINRHNYEELFLLYVDNELTANDRSMVEAFVAAHPDLKEELALLQQTTFNADAKLDKTFVQSLLKPIAEEATVSQEQLLLYIDDELNNYEAASVKKAVELNPGLQKELQWLQHSKLNADTTIVFPDKTLLYKETEPYRVFYMGTVIRRWAAAAAIILLMGSGLWLILNNNNKPPENLVIKKPGSVKPTNKEIAPTIITKTTESLQSQTPATAVNDAPLKTASNPVEVQTKQKQNSVVKNNPAVKKTTQQIPNQVQQPSPQDIAVTGPAVIDTEKNPSLKSNITDPENVPSVTNTASNVSYASYNENSASDEDNNFFNEQRQRSSGLKGLVKKAKRMLERKTGIQSGESQVRFAVFAVNTQ